MENRIRRLPLQGSPNTRDLGGYYCEGGITRWGVFLRSASPQNMTDSDIELLREYGVARAIDLRSEAETLAGPSRLVTAEGFTVHNVPMNDDIHSANFEGDLPGSMSGLYIGLVDNSRKAIQKVFSHMAEAENGLLFHCAVGKDRTGVVSMLLLKLAGVEDADVVADYAVSDVYMREVFDSELKGPDGMRFPPHVLRSKPSSMWRVLEHLESNYGNVTDYLLGCGMTKDQLAEIKNRFVEKL